MATLTQAEYISLIKTLRCRKLAGVSVKGTEKTAFVFATEADIRKALVDTLALTLTAPAEATTPHPVTTAFCASVPMGGEIAPTLAAFSKAHKKGR